MADNVVRQILESMESEIGLELGADFKKIAFVNEIEKNNFKQSTDRYGVRPGFKQEVEGVTKFMTFLHTFEIVLVKRYHQESISDSRSVDKFLDSDENIMAIYKRLINDRVGLPGIVLNVSNLTTNEPEYLVEDNAVVLRATVDILYRLTLL